MSGHVRGCTVTVRAIGDSWDVGLRSMRRTPQSAQTT